MKHTCTVVMATGLLLVGAAAQAQSLADVARQEQERRNAIKEPARLYTDADVQKAAPLTTAAARPQPATDPAKDGTAPTPPADGTSGSLAAADAKDKAPPKDEAGWRDRVTQARENVARSQRLLAAMEQQLLGLGIQAATAALAGQPAPDTARQQESAKEVDRLRADVEKYTSALSRLESDARASGIPPGWIR